MAISQMSEIILQLRWAVLLRDGAGLSDGQLLEDFISRRDEAALATLVRRHGPMVWGVCRRLLRNHHDAEDAFQATFLVLIRRATSIKPKDMVANWLYGVAHQTALKARATTAKRFRRERQVAEMPEPAVAEPDSWHDLQPLLDEELSRLPDKYRVVLVVCDLQGRTRKEAARHLGCPEGTVGGRLARARVMLAKRLARRGVVLSGGALAMILAQKVASAGVPTSIVSSTMKAASLFAAGQAAVSGLISFKVLALTEGVLKAMLFKSLKSASAVMLMVFLVGIGGGATALLAGDKDGQYQAPGIAPAAAASGITTQPVEVALDANGGRKNPYFYSPPDPVNINHLWELRNFGEYYMILPKVGEGELALDANGGKGNPYFRHSDPTNINHLWKLTKVDECYLISPKVGEGELTLDANGGRGNPCLRKADSPNSNHLWELRKTGNYYMIIPLVRRPIIATEPKPQHESGKIVDRKDDLKQRERELYNKEIGQAKKEWVKWTTKEEARRQIEKLLKRAEEAGGDRQTLLEEIENTVKEMREKAKKK